MRAETHARRHFCLYPALTRNNAPPDVHLSLLILWHPGCLPTKTYYSRAPVLVCGSRRRAWVRRGLLPPVLKARTKSIMWTACFTIRNPSPRLLWRRCSPATVTQPGRSSPSCDPWSISSLLTMRSSLSGFCILLLVFRRGDLERARRGAASGDVTLSRPYCRETLHHCVSA